MQNRIVVFSILIIGCGSVMAQTASKEWTEWAPVTGNWAEFQAVVNFRGSRSAADLAKAKLNSLKVDLLVGGRINATVPPEIEGVKAIKVLYTQLGKFETFEGAKVDFADLYYSKEGKNVRPVTIRRAASQFDVDEAAKPPSEVSVMTAYPTILAPLGVEPHITRKITGRIYRLKSEWRRRGTTVEIRLKDYQQQ